MSTKDPDNRWPGWVSWTKQTQKVLPEFEKVTAKDGFNVADPAIAEMKALASSMAECVSNDNACRKMLWEHTMNVYQGP